MVSDSEYTQGFFLGWKKLYLDQDLMPTPEKKYAWWTASCFILFTHIIWIGKPEPFLPEFDDLTIKRTPNDE